MERSAHNALMADKNSLISIQIAVTESARDKVKRLSDATDIPMKGVMSRIYEWFATLPQTAQRSILWPPENPADMDAMLIAIQTVRKLANQSAAKPNVPKMENTKREVARQFGLDREGPEGPPGSHRQPKEGRGPAKHAG